MEPDRRNEKQRHVAAWIVGCKRKALCTLSLARRPCTLSLARMVHAFFGKGWRAARTCFRLARTRTSMQAVRPLEQQKRHAELLAIYASRKTRLVDSSSDLRRRITLATKSCRVPRGRTPGHLIVSYPLVSSSVTNTCMHVAWTCPRTQLDARRAVARSPAKLDVLRGGYTSEPRQNITSRIYGHTTSIQK